MDAVTEQRTLVKSPPELWSEVGEVDSLARHLGAFGEIRITRTTAESTVAWEGERASGTVELKPSGWGTKVTLTATPVVDEPEPEPEPQPQPTAEPGVKPVPEPVVEPVPEPVVEPVPEPVVEPRTVHVGHGFLARLFGRRRYRTEPVINASSTRVDPSIAEIPETPAVPEPETIIVEHPSPVVEEARAVLTTMLDTLGAAHHRPFSRG